LPAVATRSIFGLVPGGCQTVFVFLLFGAAVSIVAAGGGRFEFGFEADLAFRPWCDGVMVVGPSLSLGMVKLVWIQDEQ
jgi:hypothetical protein